jgi:hypothetical protein
MNVQFVGGGGVGGDGAGGVGGVGGSTAHVLSFAALFATPSRNSLISIFIASHCVGFDPHKSLLSVSSNAKLNKNGPGAFLL